MAIVAECRTCGKRFKADEKQAGKKAKCSGCGTVFVIGGDVSVESGTNSPGGAPSHMASSAAVRVVARPHADPTQLQIKPDEKPAPSPLATSTAPNRASRARWISAAVVVAGVAVAGALVVPRLFKPDDSSRSVAATQSTTARTVRAVALSGSASELPPSSAAWAVLPDAPVMPLSLAADFRMEVTPAHGARFDASNIQMGAAPSPYLAIRQKLEDGSDAMEVWNIATRTRSGMVRFRNALSKVKLSQDGAYIVGHVSDELSRKVWVEIRSTSTGQVVQRVEMPPSVTPVMDVIAGFPMQDQVAILGDRLQIFDLSTQTSPREIELPPHNEEVRCASSSTCKLIALADSRALHLVDVPQGKLFGPAPIPDALTAHPRRRLAMRAMAFSPDGRSLALLFDNRLATQRVAIFDVASGKLIQVVSPSAPLSSDVALQWSSDGATLLLSGGTVVDIASALQVGQVYTDLADEGLGGTLLSLVARDSALIAWGKTSGTAVLRSVPVVREQPRWFNVKIASASMQLFDTIECAGREFGNNTAQQHLRQIGRLSDGTSFLAVQATFNASLTDDAPDYLPLRSDQFMLVADGAARSPIGTLSSEGKLSLEKPAYDLRKGSQLERKRTIVFAVTGKETSLALRIGSGELPLRPLPTPAAPQAPVIRPPLAEKLAEGLFGEPDQTSLYGVQITSARANLSYETDIDAADPAPLRLIYAPPSSVQMLAVTFEVTAKADRLLNRNVRAEPPRIGLLLPKGVNLPPVVQLPAPLPIVMKAGERYTQTCLFLVDGNVKRFRLTIDGLPLASVSPESSTARTTP